MRAPLLVIALALAAPAALADPAPSPIVLTPVEFQALSGGMAATTTEPHGLQIVKVTPELGKLGLQVNDVVRRVNGDAPAGWDGSPGHVYFLEVTRGAAQLLVKVAIKPAGPIAENVEISNLENAVVALTKSGKPSGLIVRDFTRPFEEGDVIRTIDGKLVGSSKELRTTLEAVLKAGKPAKIAFERNDIALVLDATLSLDLVAEQLATSIKKIDDTHYEIKKAFIDAILQNPMAVAKGARVVPSMKDGKANGYKLYAIRPNSVFAALGLANGDTLVAVNKLQLTSADQGLEVYKKLRDAKKLAVEIIRRGNPITITYTIR